MHSPILCLLHSSEEPEGGTRGEKDEQVVHVCRYIVITPGILQDRVMCPLLYNVRENTMKY